MVTLNFLCLDSLTLDAITAEVMRQSAKHGPKAILAPDGTKTDDERFNDLIEEIGEVARARTYDEGDTDKLVKELIQVAAIAAAWAQVVDKRSN
ncbi:MAG: hypothetical protein LC778_10340 [Acidobacteria bacterium]|nr:hypothetical protein [Acidobacteriota bacterium]